MTTQTKAPFEITKSGEVFADESGTELFNTYKSEDLAAPDEITVNVDPMTGEVNLLEEMDPASGQRPPGYGSYAPLPDWTSPDPMAQEEDIQKYREFLANVLTTDREREIQHNGFLKLRALYSTLSKGWDNNSQIEHIVKQTKNLMEIYKDAPFLEAASQVLLAFDSTLPTTRYVTKNWISKVHEIPKDRVVSFQKSAEGGHYYISGIVSDTSIDRDGDRFSYAALKQMEQAINEGVPLFQNHTYDISDTLGTPVRAELRGNQNNAELWAEFRLEDPEMNPNVGRLIHKLETGERLGFSIGGDGGSSNRFTYEMSADGNGKVRVIPGINLYEVSVVGIPSNSHSYIMGHVYKSVRI